MSRNPVSELETPDTPETADQKRRRFVYSGEAGGGSSEFLTRGNKPLKRRRKSPFKIVSLIAVVSILIVFYVWNKITVNRLSDEVDALEVKQKDIESIIMDYNAEIGRKSSRDRVEELAQKKVGMIHNPDQPMFFEVENYESMPRENETEKREPIRN